MVAKSKYPTVKVTAALTFASKMFPNTTKGVRGSSQGVHFLDSPYYYWFKFLQLNDEYNRALAGEKTKIPNEVVKDFGQVRGIEFEDWWNEHAILFAEPISQLDMKVVKTSKDMASLTHGKAVNIVVPLDWCNQDLKKAFGVLVDSLVPKRQEKIKLGKSQAKYRLGRKWSMKALYEAYLVMKYKQLAEIEQSVNGKKTSWADLGIKVRHSYAVREKMKIGDTKAIDQRVTLTILTTRAYKRAQGFLNAAVTNSFPA